MKHYQIPKKTLPSSGAGNRRAVTSSRDISEIRDIIAASCVDKSVISRYWTETKTTTVHQPARSATFHQKRREIKTVLRQEPTLGYAFALVKKDALADNVCANACYRSHELSDRPLGELDKGVNLFLRADLLMEFARRQRYRNPSLIIYKTILGRRKRLPSARMTNGQMCEPSPNYECHVLKQTTENNNEKADDIMQSQVFLYEYDNDAVPVKNPRHCLSYAVINYERDESVPPRQKPNSAVTSYRKNDPGPLSSKSAVIDKDKSISLSQKKESANIPKLGSRSVLSNHRFDSRAANQEAHLQSGAGNIQLREEPEYDIPYSEILENDLCMSAVSQSLLGRALPRNSASINARGSGGIVSNSAQNIACSGILGNDLCATDDSQKSRDTGHALSQDSTSSNEQFSNSTISNSAQNDPCSKVPRNDLHISGDSQSLLGTVHALSQDSTSSNKQFSNSTVSNSAQNDPCSELLKNDLHMSGDSQSLLSTGHALSQDSTSSNKQFSNSTVSNSAQNDPCSEIPRSDLHISGDSQSLLGTVHALSQDSTSSNEQFSNSTVSNSAQNDPCSEILKNDLHMSGDSQSLLSTVHALSQDSTSSNEQFSNSTVSNSAPNNPCSEIPRNDLHISGDSQILLGTGHALSQDSTSSNKQLSNSTVSNSAQNGPCSEILKNDLHMSDDSYDSQSSSNEHGSEGMQQIDISNTRFQQVKSNNQGWYNFEKGEEEGPSDFIDADDEDEGDDGGVTEEQGGSDVLFSSDDKSALSYGYHSSDAQANSQIDIEHPIIGVGNPLEDSKVDDNYNSDTSAISELTTSEDDQNSRSEVDRNPPKVQRMQSDDLGQQNPTPQLKNTAPQIGPKKLSPPKSQRSSETPKKLSPPNAELAKRLPKKLNPPSPASAKRSGVAEAKRTQRYDTDSDDNQQRVSLQRKSGQLNKKKMVKLKKIHREEKKRKEVEEETAIRQRKLVKLRLQNASGRIASSEFAVISPESEHNSPETANKSLESANKSPDQRTLIEKVTRNDIKSSSSRDSSERMKSTQAIGDTSGNKTSGQRIPNGGKSNAPNNVQASPLDKSPDLSTRNERQESENGNKSSSSRDSSERMTSTKAIGDTSGKKTYDQRIPDGGKGIAPSNVQASPLEKSPDLRTQNERQESRNDNKSSSIQNSSERLTSTQAVGDTYGNRTSGQRILNGGKDDTPSKVQASPLEKSPDLSTHNERQESRNGNKSSSCQNSSGCMTSIQAVGDTSGNKSSDQRILNGDNASSNVQASRRDLYKRIRGENIRKLLKLRLQNASARIESFEFAVNSPESGTKTHDQMIPNERKETRNHNESTSSRDSFGRMTRATGDASSNESSDQRTANGGEDHAASKSQTSPLVAIEAHVKPFQSAAISSESGNIPSSERIVENNLPNVPKKGKIFLIGDTVRQKLTETFQSTPKRTASKSERVSKSNKADSNISKTKPNVFLNPTKTIGSKKEDENKQRDKQNEGVSVSSPKEAKPASSSEATASRTKHIFLIGDTVREKLTETFQNTPKGTASKSERVSKSNKADLNVSNTKPNGFPNPTKTIGSKKVDETKQRDKQNEGIAVTSSKEARPASCSKATSSGAKRPSRAKGSKKSGKGEQSKGTLLIAPNELEQSINTAAPKGSHKTLTVILQNTTKGTTSKSERVSKTNKATANIKLNVFPNLSTTKGDKKVDEKKQRDKQNKGLSVTSSKGGRSASSSEATSNGGKHPSGVKGYTEREKGAQSKGTPLFASDGQDLEQSINLKGSPATLTVILHDTTKCPTSKSERVSKSNKATANIKPNVFPNPTTTKGGKKVDEKKQRDKEKKGRSASSNEATKRTKHTSSVKGNKEKGKVAQSNGTPVVASNGKELQQSVNTAVPKGSQKSKRSDDREKKNGKDQSDKATERTMVPSSSKGTTVLNDDNTASLRRSTRLKSDQGRSGTRPKDTPVGTTGHSKATSNDMNPSKKPAFTTEHGKDPSSNATKVSKNESSKQRHSSGGQHHKKRILERYNTDNAAGSVDVLLPEKNKQNSIREEDSEFSCNSRHTEMRPKQDGNSKRKRVWRGEFANNVIDYDHGRRGQTSGDPPDARLPTHLSPPSTSRLAEIGHEVSRVDNVVPQSYEPEAFRPHKRVTTSDAPIASMQPELSYRPSIPKDLYGEPPAPDLPYRVMNDLLPGLLQGQPPQLTTSDQGDVIIPNNSGQPPTRPRLPSDSFSTFSSHPPLLDEPRPTKPIIENQNLNVVDNIDVDSSGCVVIDYCHKRKISKVGEACVAQKKPRLENFSEDSISVQSVDIWKEIDLAEARRKELLEKVDSQRGTTYWNHGRGYLENRNRYPGQDDSFKEHPHSERDISSCGQRRYERSDDGWRDDPIRQCHESREQNIPSNELSHRHDNRDSRGDFPSMPIDRYHDKRHPDWHRNNRDLSPRPDYRYTESRPHDNRPTDRRPDRHWDNRDPLARPDHRYPERRPIDRHRGRCNSNRRPRPYDHERQARGRGNWR